MVYIYEDNVLMKETKDGNIDAFEKLVLKYRKNAVGFAYGFLKDTYMAEDIVQESFASIYINRNRYKPKYTFKTFLFVVIRNKCIDFIRKNKNYALINLEGLEIESNELMLHELVEQKENLRYSLKLLNKLNEDYRTVFCLYEIDGFSYKEIAEIMDKSLSQIKIIMFRARNKLQKLVKEDREYER